MGSEKISNRKFLTQKDKESIFTMDHFPLWYRRAAEHPPGSFIYSIVSEDDSEGGGLPKVVTVSTAVSVSVDGKMGIAAAVGVQITLELLQRKFWMAMQQPNDSDCSALDGACPLSCQDDILNCFLIDNNGFILISKRPAETGKFLGAVDGPVMTQLLNMGMFRRVTMYDYQAMCKVPYHHHSGAQPLLSVRICRHAALSGLGCGGFLLGHLPHPDVVSSPKEFSRFLLSSDGNVQTHRKADF